MEPRHSSNPQGLTLVEFLVAIFIVFLLLALLFPALSYVGSRSDLTSALSHAKQLQLAAMQAGLDATVTGDYSKAAWPGDISSPPKSAIEYFIDLGRAGYLTDSKVCTADDIPPAAYGSKENPLSNLTPHTCAFSIALLTHESGNKVPFVFTKNFDPITSTVNTAAKPFGGRGYVVVLMGGDGGVYNGTNPVSFSPPVQILKTPQ